MIDLIFENFYIFLVIGVAISTWLKNRGENKEEAEAERRAREEMVRQLQQRQNQPARKTTPPPVPQQWDTKPQAPTPPPAPTESSPPPLKDIFKEVMESVAPPIPVPQPAQRDAYDDEPAPWEAFQHEDASHSEIGDVEDHDPLESPMLKRQREMQERLAQIKKETLDFKGKKAAGARETQRRLERRGQEEEALVPLGSLRNALDDKRQVKRAIILKEILGRPLALR